jgi:hypothetical protein
MRTRKKDKLPNGWFLGQINRIYTVDQLERDWKEITPKDRLTIRAALEPKHNINENSDLQVHIILTGIQGKQVIQGKLTGNIPIPMQHNVANDDAE